MFIADTPEKIAFVRLVTLRGAVKMEALGLKRRGRSATVIAKELLGLKKGARRQTVIDALNAEIEEAHAKRRQTMLACESCTKMLACESCTKTMTKRCPLYASRNDEALGPMVALSITYHIAKHGKCKFHEGVCNPESMPSLRVRHCYASAIQAGQRDLFES
jgi:hypothetical protein